VTWMNMDDMDALYGWHCTNRQISARISLWKSVQTPDIKKSDDWSRLRVGWLTTGRWDLAFVLLRFGWHTPRYSAAPALCLLTFSFYIA
jgi:hypothetical protein